MIKKIKILIVTVFLTAFGGVTYASFTDGLNAAIEGDYKTALKEWQPLADQGNASAQFNLGLMYENGRGVLKDDKQATKWFRKAADQGDAEAQFMMGNLYNSGDAVDRDHLKAFKFWTLASDQGHSEAQGKLAGMYIHGISVEKDMSKAKELIEKLYANDDIDISNRAKKVWDKFELWKY